MRRLFSLTIITGFIGAMAACSTSPDKHTIAELRDVEPQLEEVVVIDSLDKAMAGYQQFLRETPANNKTPEALRRLADLQIEKEYGAFTGNESSAIDTIDNQQPVIINSSKDNTTKAPTKLAAPETARLNKKLEPTFSAQRVSKKVDSGKIADLRESQEAFESRATRMASGAMSPFSQEQAPLEAIETYKRILHEYPNYPGNDQVLYQMARAYDELGKTEQAMEIMQRLLADYPDSDYRGEVFFRRAEFFFVRKKYLDAEDAYSAIIRMGPQSSFHELALYKMGWTLYKQELYEEALHQYIALLDYKVEQGFDLDQVDKVDGSDMTKEKGDKKDHSEQRIADTLRVISLSFSNLGGAEVLDAYFATYGNRSYEDRIYSNLGEFYVTKRRFNDAAIAYQSFVELNPLHKVAPHFSMRVAEIYTEGGFPKLVVESKKDFAHRYGLQAEYWRHYEINAQPEVVSYLKANLKDLAQHYHALYQEESLKEQQGENYAEALLWYQAFLASFPQDEESPAINYQLADLHLEQKQFVLAAKEYERTAYDYSQHDQSAAAGYAAIFAHRKFLEVVAEQDKTVATRATVASSLRFANTFPQHEQAAAVLGAAADDLYAMKDYQPAIDASLQLIEQHPNAEQKLRRSAWAVAAHAYFEISRYAEAENGYSQVLALTEPEHEERQALIENLAASIYKQGELANEAGDYALAADNFLRIKQVTSTSNIRPAAEYDAAVALVNLQNWSRAGQVLRDFRATHVDHELQFEVTKQLAFVYREAGELDRSADEYRQVAKVAQDNNDPKLRSESLLMSGELYQQAGNDESALVVYRDYVNEFPKPVELNVENRYTIAGLLLKKQDINAYHRELKNIINIDLSAGADRTDRTRYLGAKSSLVMAEITYRHFAGMALVLPFEKNLNEKKKRMDATLSEMENLVDYEVGEVTAAATFYMAETYRNFSNSLLDSERPKGMNDAELAEYNLVIEDEAYPFEERAIEVHQANMELMLAGTYNLWIEKSLGQLAQLMPARYARFESSAGYIGSIDSYAYQAPLVETLTAQAVAKKEAEGENAL